METRIEAWQSERSLRETCVNSPRRVPPSPLVQCWRHTPLVFDLLSCPPSVEPAHAIYNIEQGGVRGEVLGNANCSTSIPLSIYGPRVCFYMQLIRSYASRSASCLTPCARRWIRSASLILRFMLSSQMAHRWVCSTRQ